MILIFHPKRKLSCNHDLGILSDIKIGIQGPLLLTWFTFSPSMDM